MTRKAVPLGGLSRLLACHFSLMLGTRVYLWMARCRPAPACEAVVRRDLDRLEEMIDQIGRRHAAEGGIPPASLAELSELSSLKDRQLPEHQDAQFNALSAGHKQILADIATLEAMSAADHSEDAKLLLASLTREHVVLRTAYAAEGAHEN